MISTIFKKRAGLALFSFPIGNSLHNSRLHNISLKEIRIFDFNLYSIIHIFNSLCYNFMRLAP